MTTTDERRRRAAQAFVERWTFRRGSEKGEDQQFWNDLLRSVLGVEDVESRIRYQVPVPMDQVDPIFGRDFDVEKEIRK